MTKTRVDALDLEYITLQNLLKQVEQLIMIYGPDATIEPYEIPYSDYWRHERHGGVFVLDK